MTSLGGSPAQTLNRSLRREKQPKRRWVVTKTEDHIPNCSACTLCHQSFWFGAQDYLNPLVLRSGRLGYVRQRVEWRGAGEEEENFAGTTGCSVIPITLFTPPTRIPIMPVCLYRSRRPGRADYTHLQCAAPSTHVHVDDLAFLDRLLFGLAEYSSGCHFLLYWIKK